jgi:hypothetical protein
MSNATGEKVGEFGYNMLIATVRKAYRCSATGLVHVRVSGGALVA